MSIKTWKDRIVTKLFTRFPVLVERWAKSQDFTATLETPWVPLGASIQRPEGMPNCPGHHGRGSPAIPAAL
jgi:hypothetical protein